MQSNSLTDDFWVAEIGLMVALVAILLYAVW
jgi:hypothetical protein